MGRVHPLSRVQEMDTATTLEILLWHRRTAAETLYEHGCYRIVIWGVPLCGLVIPLSIACRNGSVATFFYHSLNWTLCIRPPCWYTYNHGMGRCGMDIEAVDIEAGQRIFTCWRDDETSTLAFILTCISVFMMIVAVILYIVARITLIILAFLQLRSLHPLAFCVVQWTTYIPHM